MSAEAGDLFCKATVADFQQLGTRPFRRQLPQWTYLQRLSQSMQEVRQPGLSSLDESPWTCRTCRLRTTAALHGS
jgi:hypothetical protein